MSNQVEDPTLAEDAKWDRFTRIADASKADGEFMVGRPENKFHGVPQEDLGVVAVGADQPEPSVKAPTAQEAIGTEHQLTA